MQTIFLLYCARNANVPIIIIHYFSPNKSKFLSIFQFNFNLINLSLSIDYIYLIMI